MSVHRPVIYVVDDEPHFRKSMVAMLSAAGFDTSDYPSAEEFLEDFVDEPQSARCAVVDMNMAGLSGLGLLQKLAELKVKLPAIIITAFGNVASAVQAMRVGAVDFLEKPFHRQALLESVRRALDSAAEWRAQRAQAKTISDRLQALSSREREVVELLLAAKTTKEIGGQLGIGVKTVAKHRVHAFDKLGIESVVELVARTNPLANSGE